MDDEIREELKEVSANLHMVKMGIEQEDNKELVDLSLCAIIRSLDRIVDEIDKQKPTVK